MACMNAKMGMAIGNALGVVHSCDVDKDEATWGKTQRVNIEMELQKPIIRGRILNLASTKVGFHSPMESFTEYVFTVVI